jgi:hypothetical protein
MVKERLNATEVARFLGRLRNDKERERLKSDEVGVSEGLFLVILIHCVILSVAEGSHGESDDSVCGVLRLGYASLRMTSGGRGEKRLNATKVARFLVVSKA